MAHRFLEKAAGSFINSTGLFPDSHLNTRHDVLPQSREDAERRGKKVLELLQKTDKSGNGYLSPEEYRRILSQEDNADTLHQ